MAAPVVVAVLSSKAVIAVLLLAAGGAKLADLSGFASTVRLFVPEPGPVQIAAAGGRDRGR